MSINWQPMAAVVGAGVLAAAIAWALWEQGSTKAPPVPGYKGEAFVELAAVMPPISEFEVFNVNELNPFVSWREREAEARRLKEPKFVPVVRISKPAEIKQVDPPKYAPPRRAEGGGDAPRITGIQHGQQAASTRVVVEFPKGGGQKVMAIGETVEGWTLTGIELGNICTFNDKAGRAYSFVIGSDGSTPPASGSGAAADASKADAKAEPQTPNPAQPAKKPLFPRPTPPRPQKK